MIAPAPPRHRRLAAAAWPAARIAAERERTLAAVLVARDEAATIGPIVELLADLRDRDVLDEVVVLDDSRDATADIAAAAGADVHDQSSLHPELGPVQGKGDAMWRALSVVDADVVCFLDADTRALSEAFPCGLLGPLCRPTSLRLVKGAFRRPWDRGDGTPPAPDGGGRVTELCARPLLNRFFPDVAWLSQPLAGELAADRALLEALPFATGYATDVALLLDAWRLVGPDAIAEAELPSRQNRHRPLHELGPMASAVSEAILRRAGLGAGADSALCAREGSIQPVHVGVRERPPHLTLRREEPTAA